MSIAMISGANNMQVLENWQAVIAHNLANSSTPGFQKAAFEVKGLSMGGLDANGSPHSPQRLIPAGAATRPIGKGEIRLTGNPLDLAIRGDGFFSVQGEGGQTLYTRDGECHLDPEGVIVNTMGYPLLADGGPIEIQKDDGPVTIAQDGTVSQNGQTLTAVSVFRFNNPAMLDQSNGSYFTDTNNLGGVEIVEDPAVMQGQLEMSTVIPINEMVSMIEVSRAYEITQKLVENDEDRARKAIQTFSV